VSSLASSVFPTSRALGLLPMWHLKAPISSKREIGRGPPVVTAPVVTAPLVTAPGSRRLGYGVLRTWRGMTPPKFVRLKSYVLSAREAS
jgi:hypothetical protein